MLTTLLVQSLDDDWARVVRSADARRALARWARVDPLLACRAGLDEVVATRRDPVVANRVQLVLAGLAPSDRLAARTLLQMLLPGVVALAHTAGRAVIKRANPAALVGANPLLLGLPAWLQRLVDRNATRLRSPDDQPLWLIHQLLSRGGEELAGFETDRARFIGRGRTAAAPYALCCGSPPAEPVEVRLLGDQDRPTSPR